MTSEYYEQFMENHSFLQIYIDSRGAGIRNPPAVYQGMHTHVSLLERETYPYVEELTSGLFHLVSHLCDPCIHPSTHPSETFPKQRLLASKKSSLKGKGLGRTPKALLTEGIGDLLH